MFVTQEKKGVGGIRRNNDRLTLGVSLSPPAQLSLSDRVVVFSTRDGILHDLYRGAGVTHTTVERVCIQRHDYCSLPGSLVRGNQGTGYLVVLV